MAIVIIACQIHIIYKHALLSIKWGGFRMTPATIALIILACISAGMSESFSRQNRYWPTRIWIFIGFIIMYGAGESTSWAPFAVQ